MTSIRLRNREAEAGEGILFQAFDEASDPFQPGQLEMPRRKQRILPVSALFETLPEHDVVEHFHPHRFVPADGGDRRSGGRG